MGSIFRIELERISCAARAERAALSVTGVDSATVSTADHSVLITGTGAEPAALHAALTEAGHPARLNSVELDIDGMTCAGCAARVERALTAAPGVLEARVNFADRSARITVFAGMDRTRDIADAIGKAGYSALPRAGDDRSDRSFAEAAQVARQALIAAGLTLPVFGLEMGGHVFPMFHHQVLRVIGQAQSWVIQFLLTTLVLLGPGRGFLTRGLSGLMRREPDMNSLVAIGSMAAWLYSGVVLFAPWLLPGNARAVYFEAAAVIVTLVLAGRWLEARARGEAGAAIRALIGLQPRTAQVERDGQVRDTPIGHIAVADVLHLRPGERVAVDGQVLSGESHLDESMITGEPLPVFKSAGDAITAGTLNGSGTLRYTAQQVGQDTVLARIVDTVRTARGSRLPVQSLADRVVARFVPIVLMFALLTVLAWLLLGPEPALSHALVAGVSVLIIACPCAMGLATPTSVMAGTGRGAQLGILFRKGDALQQLEGIKVVAFDKTGTLTEGAPRIAEVQTLPGWDTRALQLAGAAEQASEHPLARAVVARALQHSDRLLAAEAFQAVSGLGVSASVDGQTILVGSARLMQDRAIDTSAFDPFIARSEAAGRGLVLIAVDKRLVAALSITDTLRPEARATIADLTARGIETAMITGDSQPAAQDIARRLGIARVVAGTLPADKADAVRALRAARGPVAFVGDGINDAPALATADVGIAMGTGTDIAMESADIVLSSDRIGRVVTALGLSRQTMRNIRQNLVWAFGYNVLLIPVAAGVLYPATGLLLSPMLAAAAMALSSVFVVTNALRLRRFQPAGLNSGIPAVAGSAKIAHEP